MSGLVEDLVFDYTKGMYVTQEEFTKVILGRRVKETLKFYENGTFQSMYAAQGWLIKNGYAYGSLCKNQPVAIVKGTTNDWSIRNLPQKWYRLEKYQIAHLIDGVMMSDDFREGEVFIHLFL